VSDRCLDQLDEAWEDAVEHERPWKRRAELIRAIIIYCRQRYGAVAKFENMLEPKIRLLEESIIHVEPEDLCAVAKAIAYGRKQIASSGEQFGSGFQRDPTAKELNDIQRDGASSAERISRLKQTAPLDTGGLDDIRTGDLDDDSARLSEDWNGSGG